MEFSERDLKYLESRINSLEDKITQLNKRQDSLDEYIYRRLNEVNERIEETMEHMSKKIDESVKVAREAFDQRMKFPERIAWMIVGTIMTGVLAAILCVVLKVGAESHRTYTPPTTAPFKGQPQ